MFTENCSTDFTKSHKPKISLTEKYVIYIVFTKNKQQEGILHCRNPKSSLLGFCSYSRSVRINERYINSQLFLDERRLRRISKTWLMLIFGIGAEVQIEAKRLMDRKFELSTFGIELDMCVLLFI